MKVNYFALAVWFLLPLALYSQSPKQWHIPEKELNHGLEGTIVTDGYEHIYQRLPLQYKEKVRDPVWRLSQNNAGMMIRFRTNATEVQVEYTVAGSEALKHMPATGVSGLDLYTIDPDGNLLWCKGNFQFGDTIRYNFKELQPPNNYHKSGTEFRLYLPLYNHVNTLRIGVDSTADFQFLERRKDLPVVVYGTSIAQGACASRPGMVWTNILSRKLDREVINLGFSGNGRLEQPILDHMVSAEAKLYVLDCLPNMLTGSLFTAEEIRNRTMHAVRFLKEKRPETPILLAEHGGYTHGQVSLSAKASYEEVNQLLRECYKELRQEGIDGVYLLPRKEMHLDHETMVDGVHPNDLGMMRYAEAYEEMIREILHEPIGEASTTKPIIQSREPNNYIWEDRHNAILKRNKENSPDLVWIANSIVHWWGGRPEAKIVNGGKSWKKYMEPLNVGNYAYGWDRVENVLWRVYHGELDGFEAKTMLIMIGTNNLHLNTDEEILEGLGLLYDAIKLRQAGARVIIFGILPRRDGEDRVEALNEKVEELAKMKGLEYANPGEVLLRKDGKIEEKYFSDGLHPNAKGYKELGPAIEEVVK